MKFLFKNEVVDYDFFKSNKQIAFSKQGEENQFDYDFFNNKNNDTILFLHGWGGNKFSFSQTINLLKNQFNILTITMPTISPTTTVWNMFDYIQLIENILSIHCIENPIVVCHSFGFRVAMLLNKKITFSKIIVTGGAGIKKENIFLKTDKNNNKILLKHENFKGYFKKIASKDYVNLSEINKETFKNVINLNLKFASLFNCPMLLFWGLKDKDTPLWIAKTLKKRNKSKLITTKSDHFAYLKDHSRFNRETLKFIKNSNYFVKNGNF